MVFLSLYQTFRFHFLCCMETMTGFGRATPVAPSSNWGGIWKEKRFVMVA